MEYVQDYVVVLPPMAESCVDVNVCNAKVGNQECRPMEPHVEQPCPSPPHVAPTQPMPHNTYHM